MEEIEQQIDDWRSYLTQRKTVHDTDIAELEDHLRGQIEELCTSGLAADEAFLVAIKRLGQLDEVSREFALEHTDRLWKQLVVAGHEASGEKERRELLIVLALAVAAAVSLKIWDLTGLYPMQSDQELPLFYSTNASFFVFPWLCGYFFWKRHLSLNTLAILAVPFLVTLVLVNFYPFAILGNTQLLSMLHLPIALWLVVGLAYTGEGWRSDDSRMDFVRFSGELFIYYVLIALGGWIFIGLTFVLFSSIGMNPAEIVFTWILPSGATGALIVAAWLVEAKQGVIENIAPVLTRVFTPLFTLMLLVFLVTMIVTGQGFDMSRDVLIVFDLVLALVLGLLLYSLSARDVLAPSGWFDNMQLCLVVCALIADLFALGAITVRIGEFGFSPNRVAALGENLILLVNLGWSANLYFRIIRGGESFSSLVAWQMKYLPVYSLWATLVVILFPPLFGFQ